VLLGAVVVVVVPALDEAPRISRVLDSVPPFVDHIVVVDDASHDQTADAALEGGDPRVTVLRHRENRGVGAAIATGYRYALGVTHAPNDALVVMAGDAQMDPRDLERVASPVARSEAGYVKGNRFDWPGVTRVMPLQRWAAGHVLSWLTSRAIGVTVHDSQCGYAALSRRACEGLDLDALWPRYGYPNDLLAQLARRGELIAEVVVRPIYADEVSRLRPRHVVTILWVVARAWVRRHGSGIAPSWRRSSPST
jgi:glycosyltransferase involved in cell wall biosynthesis